MTEIRQRWTGERAGAVRYADLRHPALPPVTVTDAGGEIWLRQAFAELPVAQPVHPADQLRAVGEAALALAALHDADLALGRISPTAIRDAGEHLLLVGLAHPAGESDRAADVRGLAEAVRGWGASDDERIAAVLTLAAEGADARSVGREALALASGSAPGSLPRPPSAVAPPATPRAAPHDADSASEWDRRRRRTRNRFIVIAVAVITVGGIAIGLLDRHGTVTVPNLVGRPEQAAVNEVRQAGLLSSTHSTAAPGSATPGTVIAQSPAAGTGVRPGGTVVLTVQASRSG